MGNDSPRQDQQEVKAPLHSPRHTTRESSGGNNGPGPTLVEAWNAATDALDAADAAIVQAEKSAAPHEIVPADLQLMRNDIARLILMVGAYAHAARCNAGVCRHG